MLRSQICKIYIVNKHVWRPFYDLQNTYEINKTYRNLGIPIQNINIFL